MKIEHIAIWVKDLEQMKTFYTTYFDGKAGEKYTNAGNGFTSYFITFSSGARLELMNMPCILENPNTKMQQHLGYIHLAFSAGDKQAVDKITLALEKDGYIVAGAPRVTGDGYYESCVLDPEGNRVEITE